MSKQPPLKKYHKAATTKCFTAAPLEILLQAPLTLKPSLRIQMNSYPSLAVLTQILATPPVTTATNKRSFSAFKYLKTCLRNTAKEVRLNSLALLYVHRDISLDFEQVVAEFLRKNRRLNFN